MAKILIYDLEVSPTLGWVYGLYDTRVIKTEEEPFIMSVSWRWHGQKQIHHLGGVSNKDEEVVIADKLWELMNEADIVVAHNANRFDNKVANACFIKHNYTPPSPYKTVDTLRVARSVAKFNSNSLNSLCDLFGIGEKSTITHASLWYDCLQGDKKAWKLMKQYNNQDVELLTQLYNKLLPWVKNHPNLGDIDQINQICPKCASPNLIDEGTHARRAGRVQSYSCGDCGGWCNENTVKKTGGRLVNA
jgi:hypothetical protein